MAAFFFDRPERMKGAVARSFALRLALALSLATASAGAETSSTHGNAPGSPAVPPKPYATNNHGLLLHYLIPAPSLGETDHSVRVFVPPGYSLLANRSRRYPVVYLLHGWPGGDGNWTGHGQLLQTLDSLFATGRIPEVIAVMPSGYGAGFFGRSFYLNSYDGKSRMEDFLAKDLVGWVDASFRTRADPAHRAVIGLSEGASGALNVVFQHPEVFGACGGHSGEYELRSDIGISKVLGPEPGATRLLADNSPALYAPRIAEQLKHQTIYFDIGLKDGSLKDNRAFDHELDSLGVAHTYREARGRHGWGYWRAQVHASLVACLAGMR